MASWTEQHPVLWMYLGGVLGGFLAVLPVMIYAAVQYWRDRS